MQLTEDLTDEQRETYNKAVEARREDKAAAVALRKDGYSYEDIADELGQTVWLVYGWANPDKDWEAVTHWREKHYPEGSRKWEQAEERAVECFKSRMARVKRCS